MQYLRNLCLVIGIVLISIQIILVNNNYTVSERAFSVTNREQ